MLSFVERETQCLSIAALDAGGRSPQHFSNPAAKPQNLSKPARLVTVSHSQSLLSLPCHSETNTNSNTQVACGFPSVQPRSILAICTSRLHLLVPMFRKSVRVCHFRLSAVLVCQCYANFVCSSGLWRRVRQTRGCT